jgi:hypothetical protein
MHMDIQPAPKSLSITTDCHYDRVSPFSSAVSAIMFPQPPTPPIIQICPRYDSSFANLLSPILNALWPKASSH